MSDYLLDTNVALRIFLEDKRIRPAQFRSRFLSGGARLIFHQTSTWELQIKYDLGQLKLPKPPDSFLPQAIEDSGFDYERMEDAGIFFLKKLPPIHRDPFDRLLVAHAATNGWTIITTDSALEKYPVRVEMI